MDILVNNLKGRDPEKDCSHRTKKKIQITGGIDMPRKDHLPGFTGRSKGLIINGKYKTFEQVHENGVLKWVENKS